MIRLTCQLKNSTIYNLTNQFKYYDFIGLEVLVFAIEKWTKITSNVDYSGIDTTKAQEKQIKKIKKVLDIV